MSLLIHPNVMSLIGLCFDEEMPLLIMPFMSKGNVLEYVKQNEVDLHKDQEASEVEVYSYLAISILIVRCYVVPTFIVIQARALYLNRKWVVSGYSTGDDLEQFTHNAN